MPRSRPILFLSDAPGAAADLDVLYPGRVAKLDFTAHPHDEQVLQQHTHVITMVTDGRNVDRLDYRALTRYARRGGKVVSCLFEYAHARGLTMVKTHVHNTMRPAMRIEAECDITRGFAAGDEVWWFGTVSSAPDPLYSNQMLQRQLFGLRETSDVTILGTSTVNGGAVMVHERVGEGSILALDLLSPNRPYYNSWGSTNKYLFVGNFVGGSVRYGKHYPRRLSYDGFIGAMHQLAARYPQLRLQPVGPCSDGRQMWTAALGEEGSPTVYLGAAIHGWEWENAFGLLRLAEVLCDNPRAGGVDTRKLHVILMPIQNPYGYDHFVRQNARGVDLNRNFDVAWEQQPTGSDVVVPWDYDYKGTQPASERETQVIQGILQRYRPRCVVDFHTADFILMLPHKGNHEAMRAVQADVRRRLRNRFIAQQPYGGAYQQFNLDRVSQARQPEPWLAHYAAEIGVPLSLLVEMSGNRDDTHGLVMVSDMVVEICLAAMRQCLRI